VRAAVSKIADMVGSAQWYLFATRGGTGTTSYFRHVTAQNRKDGSVAGLRKVLSDNVTSLDVELVPVLNHPMMRLLNGSNPVYPGHIGRSLTQVSMDLTGEAFWVLDPVENSVPEGYWIMPPHWITEMPTSGDPYWHLETPSMKTKLPLGTVIRFVSPDPLNPYRRGSGHMRAFGDEIDAYEYSSKHIRAWFHNRAVPEILITGPDLDEKNSKLLEQKWLSKHLSFLKAHRPMFLRGTGLTIKELSQKFSDMELSQLRKDDRDTIIHGLGVPPEIFGILESSNRSTISAADYHMAKYVVVPRLEILRTFLQEFLLPIYDDRLILAYENPVEEDSEFKLEVMKSQPGAFRVNDWRRLAGEEQVDDEDDVFLKPFNVEPRETLAPTPMPVAEPIRGLPSGKTLRMPPNFVPDAGHGESDGSALEKLMGRLLAAAVTKIPGDGTADIALKLSSDMIDALIEAWTALRNELDLRTIAAALENGDVASVLAMLDAAAVDAAFEDAVATLRQAVVLVGQETAAQLSEFLGETIAFDLINPAALAELEAAGAEMVTNVSDETISAVRAALVDAYQTGRTGDQVAREIRDLVGLTERDVRQMNRIRQEMIDAGIADDKINAFLDKWTKNKIKYRAQVIAENELNRAGNLGQQMLWDDALDAGLLPKDTMREWVVTPDDHLCVLCSQMAGAQVPLGVPFETPTGQAMVPQDIHVRCRCRQRLVFPKK
jgi:hypothetical protein